MILYRLTKSRYAEDLSGTGAKLYGGRWHHKGTAVLYTAENISLAILELLVHLESPDFTTTFTLLKIEAPDNSISTVKPDELPEGWNDTFPPFDVKDVGTKWAKEGETLLLKVPSVIAPEQFNYIVNPEHELSKQIKIVEKQVFRFDKRLYKA